MKNKLNVRLLRRIQKQILKEPKQFDMSWWYTPGEGVPNCGTAACIAGWAVALDKKINPREAHRLMGASIIPSRAENLLKLSDCQARALFFTSYWPKEFKWKFNNAKTSRQEAKVAVARIEHLIKTGE